VTLFVVDSSSRVPTLRAAFPHDVVLCMDFPLYARFTRSSKLKYDAWPKLKPIAKGRIDKLIKASITHRDVVGVFDPTTYGRTLARDVLEALRAVNTSLSFVFPDVFDKEHLISAKHETLENEPDIPYVVDRYITQKISKLLEEVFNVGAEIEPTRQQALVLGKLADFSAQYRPYRYTDVLGRTWLAKNPVFGELSFSQQQKTLDPHPWCLVNAPVSWDRLWGGLEKLQATGLVTHEIEMSDEIFERNCEQLERLQMTPAKVPPKHIAYWVTKPGHNENMIVDELAARPLFKWLRIETLRSCCAPADVVFLKGQAGGFEYEAPLVSSWLPLDSLTETSLPYALSEPDSFKLNTNLIPLSEFAYSLKPFLSEREIWSALIALTRRNYIKRSSTGLYLTSRGVATVLALRKVMPMALDEGLSQIFESILEETTEEGRLNMLDALFTEHSEPNNLEMWDEFFKGRPLRLCASRSAVWISSLDPETPELNYGLALCDGRIKPIKQDLLVLANCECGKEFVKNVLDAAFEPILKCDECGTEYPLVTQLNSQTRR